MLAGDRSEENNAARSTENDEIAVRLWLAMACCTGNACRQSGRRSDARPEEGILGWRGDGHRLQPAQWRGISGAGIALLVITTRGKRRCRSPRKVAADQRWVRCSSEVSPAGWRGTATPGRFGVPGDWPCGHSLPTNQ